MKKPAYTFSNIFIKITFLILILTIFYSFFSCPYQNTNTTQQQPDNNVKYDGDFVFLLQNSQLTPINYPISDYLIKPFDNNYFNEYLKQIKFDFDKVKPSFLTNKVKSYFEKCDPFLDVLLYNEAVQYFDYLLKEKDFTNILNYLEKYINEKPPEPYPIELGDFVSMYQNGIEYRYPLEKGATIIEFVDKSYQIKFEDGRIFYLLSDGTYFETFEDGSEIYFVNPKTHYFRRWFGSVLFSKSEKIASIQFGNCSINFNIQNQPFLKYSYSNKFEFNILLKNNNQNSSNNNFYLEDVKVPILNFQEIEKLLYLSSDNFTFIKNDLNNTISFVVENNMITIKPNYIKTIYALKNFDSNSKNKFNFIIDKIMAIYLPEGIKLADFYSDKPSSIINFAYNFKKKTIGNFNFYYYQDIEDIINKIREEKLYEIYEILKENIGNNEKNILDEQFNVILPSNIYQYQELLSGSIQRKFSSLPDGFTRDDIIISWPLNLPRYIEDKDMSYFFEKEFYNILLFQMIKKQMIKQTGFFGRLPFFLETGFAIYLASLYNENLKESYDSLFVKLRKANFSFDQSFLILTNSETSSMPSFKYLTAYSYRLIKYIVSIYGNNKIIEFIKTFKININNNDIKLIQSNQSYLIFSNRNITQVFGVTFDKLLEAFLMLK